MSRAMPSTARASLLLLLFGLAAAIIVVRSGYIQLMDKEYFEENFVEKEFMREELVPARRGMFLDRNGSPLAASSPLYKVAIDPKQLNLQVKRGLETGVSDKVVSREVNKKLIGLANVFGLNQADLIAKFASLYEKGRQYMVISKEASPGQAREVQGLLPQNTLILNPSYQRQYPDAQVIGGLIGYTQKNVNNGKIVQEKGVEGLEKLYEPTLAGIPRRVKMIRARNGESLEALEVLEERQDGTDIQLSIDRRIQYYAYKALLRGVRKNKAAAGSVIVMKPQTGEILAMVNLPTINPNNITDNELKRQKNFTLLTPIEPGSTVKPLTVALGMETGVINADTKIDTGNGKLKVSGFTIKDLRPGGYGAITPQEVLVHSSNVGASNIAKLLGAKAMHKWYEHLGFGHKTGLSYPGESSGILRSAKKWRESGLYTHSYGYGFQVTLTQLLKAYTVLANDGFVVEPTMIKRDEPISKVQLISESTAKSVRKMMTEVIERKGAGASAARVPGFDVAGKTGTVHVAKNGQYQENKYRSLFVGMLPAEDPELLAVVMIDDPRATDARGDRIRYGSLVSAPIFGDMMKDIVRLVSLRPTKVEAMLVANRAEGAQ